MGLNKPRELCCLRDHRAYGPAVLEKSLIFNTGDDFLTSGGRDSVIIKGIFRFIMLFIKGALSVSYFLKKQNS